MRRRRRRRRQEERIKKTFLWFFACERPALSLAFSAHCIFPLYPNLDFLICRMREKKTIFGKIQLFSTRIDRKITDRPSSSPSCSRQSPKIRNLFSFHTSGVFLRGKEERACRPMQTGCSNIGGRGMSGTQGYEVPGIFPVPQLNYMQISSQKISAKSTYTHQLQQCSWRKNNLWFVKEFFWNQDMQETNLLPHWYHTGRKQVKTHILLA